MIKPRNNVKVTTKQHETGVLIATILASSMAFIDSTALNVALPALQADLGVDGSQLLWIVNGYALFLSALLLVGGALGDLYGRKRVFLIGILLFTISSVLCGLSQSPLTLIISRCIQGVGGALMVPGSLSIISATFLEEKRGWAIGTWSMFSAMTTVFGPALGGVLAEMGLWRLVFFLNVPLALISIGFLLTRVPETKNPDAKKIDLPGALLATAALAGLTYGFIEAPEKGFGSPIISMALLSGGISLLLFLWRQRRCSFAMMPLTLFRSGVFGSTNLLTLLLYGALGGFLFFFPLNLIQIQGYSAEIAGFTILPLGLTIALLSRWSGVWSDKVGVRIPLIIGPAIAGAGFFAFSLPELTAGPQDFWTTFLPAVLLVGAGMGITVAPLTTAVMNAVPVERTGIASGVNNTIARTAGVLGVAVMGSFVLLTFENSLMDSIGTLNFTEEELRLLKKEIPQLGNAKPPGALDEAEQASTMQGIRQSFIAAFNGTAIISSILALGSAAIAFFFVHEERDLPS